MNSELMQAALGEVVKLMDENEITQPEAIQLVANAMGLSLAEAAALSDAYDAM